MRIAHHVRTLRIWCDVVAAPAESAPTSPIAPILAAAAEVVDEKGPKVKAVFSAMNRGLDRRLGAGTWTP